VGIPFEKTSFGVKNQSEEKDKDQGHESAKNRGAEPGSFLKHLDIFLHF
jgi:hypothetical protein